MKPLRVVVNGVKGRMGQTVIHCAQNDPQIAIARGIDLGDELMLDDCDALIDFSHADATPRLAEACALSGKTLVIGTTGHDGVQLDAVKKADEINPIEL